MVGPVTEATYSMYTDSPDILVAYEIISGLKYKLIGGMYGFTFTKMDKNQNFFIRSQGRKMLSLVYLSLQHGTNMYVYIILGIY